MKQIALFLGLISLASCSRHEPDMHDDNEGITTVQLTFKSVQNPSDSAIFSWRDGSAELVQLNKNQDYNLSINYLNESGLKTQDLTSEIEDESDAHLVIMKTTPSDLFNISSYDKDSKGRKLGLKNKLRVKNSKENGSLRVILKHQPPVNGKELKDGVDESVGSTDSDVSFSVIVK